SFDYLEPDRPQVVRGGLAAKPEQPVKQVCAKGYAEVAHCLRLIGLDLDEARGPELVLNSNLVAACKVADPAIALCGEIRNELLRVLQILRPDRENLLVIRVVGDQQAVVDGLDRCESLGSCTLLVRVEALKLRA